MTTPNLTHIDRDLLRPSPMNPRKHFDPTYLDQLAASIKEKGILEPLLVRAATDKKRGGVYEIVAGECRYRAAGIAELQGLPCIIRELDDQQAMEIQIIENLHRKDLTPLEEAAGFRALINSNPDKHTAASLGARLGKSARWVWDIMKLVDLIPEAKELLDRGIISVNHAIPISRLTPAQQTKLTALNDGSSRGLFVHQGGLNLHVTGSEEPKDKYAGWKPVTVRELIDRINTYIRFDVSQAAKAAPLLFDETAEQVAQAEQRPGRGKKVVAITHLSYVQPEAKGDEKTFREGFWKRADGNAGSKTCEHSVLGVVAVGPGQGGVFEVCVNRDKCMVHWGSVIRAKAKRQKERQSGTGSNSSAPAKKSQYQIDEERRQAARAKAEERWTTFGPALRKATEEKLHALPANVPKHIFQWLLKKLQLPKDTQPADLVRALVIQAVAADFRGNEKYYPGDYWEKKMIEAASAIGVNVKALGTPDKSAAASTTKPAAKKKAAKKR